MSDYFIIGADAAGLSAAVQIKREIPDASLKVINKGKIISYAACGIPYVLSGDVESVDNLIHYNPESIKKNRGISVEIQQEAVNIDPEEKAIEIKNLKTGDIYKENYKKLLIATGSEPNKLPFINYEEQGIFKLHNLEDLKKIIAFIKDFNPQRAAVIGAGNIGLELVEALYSREIEVILFEVFPEPAMLWPPLVRKAISKKIKEKNINFIGNTHVKEVNKETKGFIIKTDKESYQVDMVFSVVGTKPATEFCKDKLKTNKNNAIIINRKGMTSEPDIYAAGDCATVYNKILDRSVYFPLGSTANKMGRIAGLNMAGKETLFPGIVGTQIFKFLELSLAKTGLSLEEAQKEGIKAEASIAKRLDKSGYYPGAKFVKAQTVYDKSSGRIWGASVVSEGNAAQFIDPLAVAVYAKMNVEELGWFDAAYSPPTSPVWNAWVSAALKHK